jgi:hypothetical protein
MKLKILSMKVKHQRHHHLRKEGLNKFHPKKQILKRK